MRQYEVNLIVDPVLSQPEIASTASTYSDMIKEEGGSIVHVDEMGLKQLAYPIKRRNTGIYYCIEFQVPIGNFVDKLELALRRDERIMRFLTVKLDKYGVKYNDDKRNGLIGKVKKSEAGKSDKPSDRRPAPSPKPVPVAPKAEAPAPAAPKAEAPAPKAEAPAPAPAAPKEEAPAPVAPKAEAPVAAPVAPKAAAQEEE